LHCFAGLRGKAWWVTIVERRLGRVT